MPNRAPWEPGFSIGHPVVDAQHQQMLALCNQLAELCLADDLAERDQHFDQALADLKALVLQHRDTEAALLARGAYPDLDDHRLEFDEFDYVASEIGTTENFDRLELQRFVTHWCVGHIVGSASRQRQHLSDAGPAA